MEAMLGISVYKLSISQLGKMLCLSYYLYSLFNKIREKGRTVSAWKWGGREGEGGGWREGAGDGGRNDPNIICTYK
jgi:hypothetical protein